MPSYDIKLLAKIKSFLKGDIPNASTGGITFNDVEQEIVTRSLALGMFTDDLFYEDVAGVAPKLINASLVCKVPNGTSTISIISNIQVDHDGFEIELNSQFVETLQSL